MTPPADTSRGGPSRDRPAPDDSLPADTTPADTVPHRAAMAALLAGLVRIPSVGGSAAEIEIQERLAAWMRAEGLEVGHWTVDLDRAPPPARRGAPPPPRRRPGPDEGGRA